MTAVPKRRSLLHEREETIPHTSLEPIYAELAQHWSDTGRIVPGQPDREWTALVDRARWPAR